VIPTTQKVQVLSGNEALAQQTFLKTAHALFYSNDPRCLAYCDRVAFCRIIDDEGFERILIPSRFTLSQDLLDRTLTAALGYELAAPDYKPAAMSEIDSVSNVLLTMLQ